jgi:hypothetical protein
LFLENVNYAHLEEKRWNLEIFVWLVEFEWN